MHTDNGHLRQYCKLSSNGTNGEKLLFLYFLSFLEIFWIGWENDKFFYILKAMLQQQLVVSGA